MEKLTNPFVWLCRIRHRCGYGVHSPFAFRFITDVVYETARFYAYDELDPQLSFGQRFRVRRLLHLFLRIVNHLQPSVIYLSPEHQPLAGEYLRAGCRRSRIDSRLPDGTVDLLVLSSPDDDVPAHLAEGSVLIMDNLRQHRQWFRALPSVVSFDLWDVGIAFFNPKYNKQHYIVNF